MPAAAKVESRINMAGDLNNKCKLSNNGNNNNNNGNNQQAQDPTKIANTIIEKKIRNLEKRKSRLLEIKALEDKGQQLEPDQVTAVKKLDSVVEMIDMLKEINKNVTDSLNEYAKQQKKLQKKEQQDKLVERHQMDLDRIKLFLRIQKLMPHVSSIQKSSSKDDSIEFEDKHIEVLKNLSEISNDTNDEPLNDYAEKIHLILDGSKKEFSHGVSHLEIKELFVKLIDTRYFDKVSEPVNEADVNPTKEDTVAGKSEEPVSEATTPKESQTKINVEKPSPSEAVDTVNQPSSAPSKVLEPVNADLQNDPAVIAAGSYAYPFSNSNCPVNFLATTNPAGVDYPLIYSNCSVSTIPTQTFTNPNFAGFIATKPVQMYDATAPLSNQASVNDSHSVRNQDSNQINSNENKTESINDMEQLNEAKPMLNMTNGDHQTSQEIPKNDISNMNGHGSYKPRLNNYRGNSGRGNPRFGGNNSFRGRGNPKNFGYFNNGPQGSNANFAPANYQNGNRSMNRQNAGNRMGYRSNDRNTTRNFNPNQGPSAALVSKSAH